VDTAGVLVDSIALTPTIKDSALTIRISKDSLTSRVEYGGRDSMIFDNVEMMVHLYGEAFVNYESLILSAHYIVVDLDSSIAIAEAGRDSLNNIIGVPEFVDGEQKFNALKMRYNFKTKKGLVFDAVTQESDVFVRGGRTKYIAEADTTNGDDFVFSENAIFTTCDHPEPHYGIRSSKQKLVPNKLVVIGPSVVEIGGVPTPLVLPFAFFPLAKGKRSGLIFPRDYEYSQQWGFGLRELGYYFPINDYMDLRLMGDIYFSGTWAITARSSYTKKYKYRGNLELAFGDRIQEFSGDYRKQHQRSFKIIWSHTQDKKSNPYHNFSGNVNFQLNRFDQLNRNDAASVLNNTIRSKVEYRRTFPDQPYSLTMALSHSQNQNTGQINIAFPELRFNVRQIQPFKKKDRIGEPRWYEDIGMSYAFDVKSKYNVQDSLFLKDFSIDDLNYGAKHTLNISSNYAVLKYLRFNTSVKFTEFWHFQRQEKTFDPTEIYTVVGVDTSSNGTIITEVDTTFGTLFTDTTQKFTPFHDFSISTGLSTKLFGTARFKGKVRGIRHVMTPSVNFRYSPNYQDPYLKYWDRVPTDSRYRLGDTLDYSVFLPNAIGTPSVNERELALSFRLENNFEAKYFSKADSAEKNVKLLDKISIWTDYNYAREELKWNPVSMSTFTKLFGGLTNVNIGARFDPYAVTYDENGRATRIDKFAYKETGHLLRFDRADANFTTRFTIKQLADLFNRFSGKSTGSEEDIVIPPPPPETPLDPFTLGPGDPGQPGGQLDNQEVGESLFDLFAKFSISHSIRLAYNAQQNGDTLIINNHFIELNGGLKLSENWNVGFSRIGYNFKQKTITYPDLSFTRKLHCWQLTFSWQPVYGTYSMFIGVNPGSMDFLKIPYRRNNVDTFY
jgi:hypothetical protein